MVGAVAHVPAAERPDILIADFEGNDWGHWKATGTAFGPGPARGTLPGQMAVSGFEGGGLVNSFVGGDGATGSLTSPPFGIERRYLHFLIGGGHHPGKTCINLIVDGKVVRSATGPNQRPGGTEQLYPESWDVAELAGKLAHLEFLDQTTGGWGHINVDHIVLSDRAPSDEAERAALLARATKAVAAATPQADADPTRPAFHFRPPAQWMNDPNGTIYHEGFYHVFYQHNPYGDGWGNMHWGHARSRDLVHWEHLPIALWPSKSKREDHIFSGCAARSRAGNVVLFYTSVGGLRPNEQWAALPRDPQLREWDKYPTNPLVTTEVAGSPTFGPGMRDPFVFHSGGRTFLVVGADYPGEAVIPIFEADDSALLRWQFRGILWRADKKKMEFPECPNFFELGGKAVLLCSPYRPVEYRVGQFDSAKLTFREEVEGVLDHGPGFYASNIAFDPRGRCILFGWVRGFKSRGWNGVLALPRVLTLGPDGRPRQTPVAALETLRSDSAKSASEPLTGERNLALKGNMLELRAEVALGSARSVGIRFATRDAGKPVLVRWDGRLLHVAGTQVPLSVGKPGDSLRLHVYLDRTVLEVFAADGQHAVTAAVDFVPPDADVKLFADGGSAQLHALEAWRLEPIWPARTAQ
jgi:sucrose-6-phosphate hydrolase SacC (GH32 family)